MVRPLLLLLALMATPMAQAQDPADPADPAPADNAADAVSLSKAAQGQDEAIAVLLGGLSDPASAQASAARLGDLLLRLPPRSAWLGAYAAAAQASGPDRAKALQRRALIAQAAGTQGSSSALGRLAAESSTGPAEREAHALALLLRGSPKQAAEVLQAEGSSGRLRDLATAGQVGGAPNGADAFSRACASADTAACARALAAEGFPRLGAHRLRATLAAGATGATTPADRGVLWDALAHLERASGQPLAAASALLESIREDGLTPARREARVAALLAAGRTTAAGAAAGDVSELQKAVQAHVLLARAGTAGSTQGRGEALSQAMALHPDSAVRRAAGAWQFEQGQPEAAWTTVQGTLPAQDAGPGAEGSGLGVIPFIRAAVSTGHGAEAVDAARRGLATTVDAQAWQVLRIELSQAHAVAAEARKRADDLEGAVRGYEMAHAMDPSSVIILVGLGGVRWSADDLAGAEAAYRDAWARAPGNRNAMVSLAGVLAAAGKLDEAEAMIRDSGYGDLRVQALLQDVAVAQSSRDAREALQAGDFRRAITLYEQLLAGTPDHPALLQSLGDAYAGLQRYEAAHEAYARALLLTPDDPWLLVGYARLKVSQGEPAAAQQILDELRTKAPDPALLRQMASIEVAIRRSQADALRAAGDTLGAFEIYATLLAEQPDTWILTGLASLYMERWQHNVAQAFYEEALDLDPDNDAAAAGVIEALLARGDLARAEERAGALAQRSASPEIAALAGLVERRRAVEKSIEFRRQGRLDSASVILAQHMETWPDDPDLNAAMAAVELELGRIDGAWQRLEHIYADHPTHDATLSVMLRVGGERGDHGLVIERFDAAIAAGAARWVRVERQSLEIAARMDRARRLARQGSLPAARTVIEQAEERQATGSERHWTLIGGGWLAVGEPQRALAAYEVALSLDPSRPGPVRGKAGALMAMGRAGAAEGTLQDHWDQYGSPVVGAELARVQAQRGYQDRARRTVDALDRAAETPMSPGAASDQPEPLPVLPLPSGRVPESAEDRVAPGAVAGAVELTADPTVVRREVLNKTWSSTDAGFGFASRPGDPGRQRLTVLTAPISVELPVYGPYRLNIEAVPLQISNGDRTERGLVPSVGLHTPAEGPLAARIRLGTSPLGMVYTGGPDTADIMWDVALTGRLGTRLEAELSSGRAPVTDTMAAWIGDAADDGGTVGRVSDRWYGGRISSVLHLPEGQGDVGGVARVGESRGPTLASVPWNQGFGWVGLPLQTWQKVDLRGAANALVMTHDRQVGGFDNTDGAMFTPRAYYSGSVRAETRYHGERERFSACADVGVGVQQVVGEQTLYLGPGTYLGYTIDLGLHQQLAQQWVLLGHYLRQGSDSRWAEDVATLRIRYGTPASHHRAPSSVLGSPVHGPPLAPLRDCGGSWAEANR